MKKCIFRGKNEKWKEKQRKITNREKGLKNAFFEVTNSKNFPPLANNLFVGEKMNLKK